MRMSTSLSPTVGTGTECSCSSVSSPNRSRMRAFIVVGMGLLVLIGGSGSRPPGRSVVVLDPLQAHLLEVEAGGDATHHDVVDGAGAAQSEQDLALAVEQGELQARVLLVSD